MKSLKQCFNFFIISLLCGMFYISCTSDEPAIVSGNNNTPDTTTLTVEDLDNLSDQLSLFGATISTGKTPPAPGGSGLKISIRDTLYLPAGVPMPVKFLHDELTDVTGAYIQVRSFQGSTNTVLYGTNYYQVPELVETGASDTVSTVLVGFLPTGDFDVPLSFEITITPIGTSGQPLDETVVPVVVDAVGDETSQGGDCGPPDFETVLVC